MTTDPPPSPTSRRPAPHTLATIIPAWGTYVSSLPDAVRSAPGTVVVVTDPAGREAVRALDCVVVDRPPGGIGAARQAGLRATSADYVVFLDADDRLISGAVSRLVALLERSGSDVHAACGTYRRRSDGSTWPDRLLVRLVCLPGGGPLLLARNVLPTVGSCVLRRESIVGRALFPDLEDEDWHAAVRLRARGRVRFVDVHVLDYDDRPGSVSRRPRTWSRVQESHDALLTSSGGGASWRLAEPVLRPVRRYRAARLRAAWGDSPTL